MFTRIVAALVTVAALVLCQPSLGAAPQQTANQLPPPGQPPPLPAGDQPISAAQIQLWFEAFTVLQAQDALQLSEAQYGRFVTRLKALQETRRRHQQARGKILNELRRLTGPNGTNDEAAITEGLRALRDEDDRAAVDVRKGYEGIDETLEVKQQARFRIFEENMEQRKLELLMRARQNARAARGRKGGL